jgi:hypothetical protein
MGMPPTRSRLLGGSLVPVLAALAVSGSFADAESAQISKAATVKNLWATVNVCDTQKHPDSIGIRGRAPGDRHKDHNIWMRFFVQYQKAGVWADVAKGGRTGWRKIGSADYDWREYGVTFPFDLKPAESYRMRGHVKFEWRAHGEVLKHRHEYTASGHHAAGGGDPKGYSAATCFISGGTGAGRSLSRRPLPAKRADLSAARRPPSTRTADPPPAGPTGPDGATPATSAP